MALIESFSGIRGVYGKDLTEGVAIRYAYAYSTFLKNKTKKNKTVVVIGTDARPSGQILIESIIKILDCNFIEVGIAPTPAIEFAVRHFKADGGIIITASHNEPNWNGFKFLSSDGAILSEQDINKVINNFANLKTLKDFHKIQDRGLFQKNAETVKGYADFVLKIVGKGGIEKIKNSKQKIVLDPNGGSGIIAQKILEGIGVEVIGVNTQYGEFKRQVEPTENSLNYLKGIIKENNADFAAGFDCDADRIEILMSNGKLLSGNYILAVVVKELLSRASNPARQAVVVNDATSNVVGDIVKKFNAKLIEVEVGETNVVEKMKKSNALVGGEGSSGGVIISPSKCRDGILTLIMVLSIIAEKQKNLLEIIEELPKYFTLKRKMEFDASKQITIKSLIKDYYSKKGFSIRELGGVKGSLKVITGKNSFVWFRASKTEGNAFRIITDSNNKQDAERLMEEAVNVFEKSNAQ